MDRHLRRRGSEGEGKGRDDEEMIFFCFDNAGEEGREGAVGSELKYEDAYELEIKCGATVVVAAGRNRVTVFVFYLLSFSSPQEHRTSNIDIALNGNDFYSCFPSKSSQITRVLFSED